jgi:putative nucleotidyltransferase with HDIG domain
MAVELGDQKPTASPVSLQDIAGSCGDLPALPGTAIQAMQLSEDPNVNARSLQGVISRDQALTARILKIVNSAMYCFEREVSTLSHAIAILGLDTVRSVIVAAAVQQTFRASSAAGKDLASKLLWEHSMGAAMAAKAIAGRAGYGVFEEAFTCGLLHDLGKMVLLKNQTPIYTEILNRVYCGESSFSEAEISAFGFSHVHVGALLATRWRFPAQLVEGILYHHDFTAAPAHRRLAAIASMADSFMIHLEIGFRRDPSLNLENEPAASYLNLTPPVLQKIAAELRTMIPRLPGQAPR